MPMIIYELYRKDVLLAIMSPSFALTPYYLKTTDISEVEHELVKELVDDLFPLKTEEEFKTYSQYWINDYTLKRKITIPYDR